MIVYVGDLTFKDGVLTPPASWNAVQFPIGAQFPAPAWETVDEIPLGFGDCEHCGATIGLGEPMICDDCLRNL